MTSDENATFSGVAVSRWQQRLGKLRDVVRQELVSRQLAGELPRPPCRALDIGCGQGTQALRLARLGYHVTGLDPSAELLGRFETGLAAEPAEVRARVRLDRGDAAGAAERYRSSPFEIVLCHGVLMYLEDPGPVLTAIGEVTSPGGVVSLLVRNGDALAMRPGLLGDWKACAEGFRSGSYLNRIGIRARADRLAELTGLLAAADLRVSSWYGVRVFTDTADDDAAVPGDVDELLACEEQAARTDPYRQLAALLHVIASRLA